MAVTKLPVSETEVRYASDAIQLVGRKQDEFYKLWLGLATRHALDGHRHLVSTADFEATLQEAVGKLIENASAATGAPAE